MFIFRTPTFLFIFLISSVFGHGQTLKGGIPKIINFSKSDYQSGTQNWGIDQDKNGNIYLANNNGLLQFDGSKWHKYKIPNSANIRSVAVHDRTGRIYVGGYNEFGYFKSNAFGSLEYVSLLPKIPEDEFKLFDFLWKIHLINDEVIFQSFKVAFILKDNKITILKPPHQFQFSFLVGNKLYFQDIQKGILEYKDQKLHYIRGSEFFNNSEIWGMFNFPGEKLIINTLERGIFIFEEGKITPWKTEANDFSLKNSSLGGAITSNQHIILNSVLDGVIVCNLEGQILQHINLKGGLQNNTVLTSFVDQKENLWLGLDNGVSFVNINSPFKYFSSSLNFSTVYAAVVHNNALYTATNQGVFYNNLKDLNKNKAFKKVKGTAVQSWNIQVIGNELICANNNGALIIENDRVAKVLDNKGYFGFKEIPNHPKYVLGAHYRGFAVFEKTPSGLVFRNHLKDFNESSTFFEMDQSFLWLLKNQYLYQLKISDDLQRLEVLKTLTEIPGQQIINGMGKINNEIIFKSNNKFYNYQEEEDQFISAETLDLLFTRIPNVNLLKEDQFGNIWYTMNDSLGQYRLGTDGKYEENPETFSNLTDNLVVNYLSVNAIDKENTYIGLIDGLAHYEFQTSQTVKANPNLFIRSFTYDEKVFYNGNPSDSVRNHHIPFEANNVQFTFSSPEFERPQNVTYSYKLEPFDDEWSHWSNNTVKEYTNLREGKYTMNVLVKNGYGLESEKTQLFFSILPPWYRHIIAYIIYGILLILSLYLSSVRVKAKIRKNKYYEMIEQRKRYLEKESKIKIEQYQLEKEIEKLNREKLQTSILSKDKELVNNSLQVVKKNKILNGIIKKLKEMDVGAMDGKTKTQITRLKRGIVKEVNNDDSWKDLEKHIKNVHFDFLKRLKEKYPSISPRELDLSTYLLINMTTKEIAEVMNITTGGVELARYRLRKKLGMNRKQNLTGFLMDI